MKTAKFMKAVTTHGMSKTRTYHIWQKMRYRCADPNYRNYGAKGIKVCDRWINSFENFFKDMGLAPNDCSIDRINGNKNYEPSNCRWATRIQQNQNTSKAINLTFNGMTFCVSEWARRIGISEQSLSKRLRRWNQDRALSEPKEFNACKNKRRHPRGQDGKFVSKS